MPHCSSQPELFLTQQGFRVMLGAALREISIPITQSLLTCTVKDFCCSAGTIGDGAWWEKYHSCLPEPWRQLPVPTNSAVSEAEQILKPFGAGAKLWGCICAKQESYLLQKSLILDKNGNGILKPAV